MSERKRKEGREGRSSDYNAASAEAITSLHHTTVVVTDYHRVTGWALLATMSCAKHAPHKPVLAKGVNIPSQMSFHEWHNMPIAKKHTSQRELTAACTTTMKETRHLCKIYKLELCSRRSLATLIADRVMSGVNPQHWLPQPHPRLITTNEASLLTPGSRLELSPIRYECSCLLTDTHGHNIQLHCTSHVSSLTSNLLVLPLTTKTS